MKEPAGVGDDQLMKKSRKENRNSANLGSARAALLLSCTAHDNCTVCIDHRDVVVIPGSYFIQDHDYNWGPGLPLHARFLL